MTRSARDRPVEASIVPASRAQDAVKEFSTKSRHDKPSVLQMSSRRRKLLRCLSASFREQLQEYVRQEFDCSRIMRMATKCSLFRSYSLKQSTMTISTRAPRYNDTNQALLLLESLVHSCHWWILDFQSLTFSCYSYFLLFLSSSHHS